MTDQHNNTNGKSATVAYLLWFFLGGFGAHRFYMGRKGSGFGMLGLFAASCILSIFAIGLIGFPILGIWWVVDAFLINKWMKEEGQVVGAMPSAQERHDLSQAA
jgi:TM2 domain-containing membrane protein YozV